MKKVALTSFLVMGWLCLAAGLSSAQDLRSGESAVFLKNGDKVIVKIIDISSTRLVLETENSGEFPLQNIWMINFVSDKWNFPEERDKIEGGDHYVFLKDGGVTSGQVIDFSSDQRVFELNNGEKIGIGRIRRIYFAKQPPDKWLKELKEIKEERKEKAYVGTYRSVGEPEVVLTLNEDMTAKMIVSLRPDLPKADMIGRWELTAPDKVTVRTESRAPQGARITRQLSRVFTFRREGNELIGENHDPRVYGELRLRKT